MGAALQVQQLIHLINIDPRSLRAVAKRAGVDHATIITWERGVNPKFLNMEAVLNALGHTLKVVPIDDIQAGVSSDSSSHNPGVKTND